MSVALFTIAPTLPACTEEAGQPDGVGEEGYELLHEVWQHVEQQFYDPDFNGVAWAEMLERYGPMARQARNRVELTAVINRMLDHLDTSHTMLLSAGDPRYYQLLDVFSGGGRVAEALPKIYPDGTVRYADTGIIAEEIDGKVFITNIIDGMPAAATEVPLLVGDEIVSVDGKPFRPLQSAGKTAGPPLRLRIRRSPESAELLVELARDLVQPRQMYLRAMTESARVIEHEEVTVAYVHVWSWAGQHYQDRLVELVNQEPISTADALVLDIRDGWGGASSWYLNLFNQRLPVMTMIERDREAFDLDQVWRKPVVLLINQGSRSGKEVIAFGFKSNGIGPVVGTPTAGDVVAGSAWVLSDGSLLYLAVADVLVDGQRLEGVGVEPDVLVPFDRRYAAGSDPQLDRAVAVAAAQVGSGTGTGTGTGTGMGTGRE
jgi:carboxyl-terminal processing protease